MRLARLILEDGWSVAGRGRCRQQHSPGSAEGVLRERYARGEIDETEYRQAPGNPAHQDDVDHAKTRSMGSTDPPERVFRCAKGAWRLVRSLLRLALDGALVEDQGADFLLRLVAEGQVDVGPVADHGDRDEAEHHNHQQVDGHGQGHRRHRPGPVRGCQLDLPEPGRRGPDNPRDAAEQRGGSLGAVSPQSRR